MVNRHKHRAQIEQEKARNMRQNAPNSAETDANVEVFDSRNLASPQSGKSVGGKTQGMSLNALRALATLPGALMGRFFDGLNQKRNLYEVFGWDTSVSTSMMHLMYERGGVAKRVVDAYPEATWGRPPRMVSDLHPEMVSDWNQVVNDFDLWGVLSRLDQLSRMGHFAILVMGTTQSRLNQPVRDGDTLAYLQPYGERSVQISQWETDQTNVRFGLPREYAIYPKESGGVTGRGGTQLGFPTRAEFKVHWSHVVHVAQGALETETLGTPMMKPIWNYLTDLQKVTGGAAESYWLTANRGIQVDVDKEMQLQPEDEAGLDAEVDDYVNKLSRVIRTRGVKVRDLGSSVADPKGPYSVLMQLISGTSGIPQRVLIGSEAGQMASTQDKANWAERVEEYRGLTAEPRILSPLIVAFQQFGLLPQIPNTDWEWEWPEAYRMSPLERGQAAAQTGRTFASISRGYNDLVTTAIKVAQAEQGFSPSGTPYTDGSQPPAADGSQGGTGTDAAGNTPGDSGSVGTGSGPTVHHIGDGAYLVINKKGVIPEGAIPLKITVPDLLNLDEMRRVLAMATDGRILDRPKPKPSRTQVADPGIPSPSPAAIGADQTEE